MPTKKEMEMLQTIVETNRLYRDALSFRQIAELAAETIAKEFEAELAEREAEILADFAEDAEWRSKLLAENERLTEWVNDCQAGMYINCVYCGHRYGPDDEVPATMAQVLKEHIEQCPQHPMSAVRTELAAREIQVAEIMNAWNAMEIDDTALDGLDGEDGIKIAVLADELRRFLAALSAVKEES